MAAARSGCHHATRWASNSRRTLRRCVALDLREARLIYRDVSQMLLRLGVMSPHPSKRPFHPRQAPELRQRPNQDGRRVRVWRLDEADAQSGGIGREFAFYQLRRSSWPLQQCRTCHRNAGPIQRFASPGMAAAMKRHGIIWSSLPAITRARSHSMTRRPGILANTRPR